MAFTFPDIVAGSSAPATPRQQELNNRFQKLAPVKKMLEEEKKKAGEGMQRDDSESYQLFVDRIHEINKKLQPILAEMEQISREYHEIKFREEKQAAGDLRQSPFAGLSRDQFPPAKPKTKTRNDDKKKLDDAERELKAEEGVKKSDDAQLDQSLEMLKGKFGTSSRK